ncbi:GDP-L-fucose synthase [Microbulbifer sp. GL-2]|uniref:GDP-L-fucose synthase n=1 Tax=Microbulbifer sp. GL-2 TaxID=2591606 RepID=UPI0011627096|nr:GDP-L-fucose synthase [Microbulbifer sp. GL-2]BBM03886.1 GDP-L-fucose synthase [Microbulbifer sp. GL-2]
MKKRIFIAGHRGMVGSALVRAFNNIEGFQVVTRARADLDLTSQAAVNDFFINEKIDAVYLAAARVGGIYANANFPANFIYENLSIANNVIHEAFSSGVKKLLFFGSSCIYPRVTSQPIPESALLQGSLEPTNEPYAIAKIAGIKLCESYNRQYGTDYRSVMPTNLYGPNDNFHPRNSHVIPALIRRFHEAKINGDTKVEVWGSGSAMRDFLHVDDLAQACVHVMQLPEDIYSNEVEAMASHINIGSGSDCSIREIAEKIAQVVGFPGELFFNSSMPDGTPRKLLDASFLNSLGWQPNIQLEVGLKETYKWFLANKHK